MRDPLRGVLAVIGAALIWGSSPLYYKMLVHVPPLELLSHRTLWSLVFFSGVLLAQRRLRQVSALILAPRTLVLVALAAAMISINWFQFIYAIQIGRAVEASLGYFIFPLAAVVLGVLLFGEGLSRGKAIALALATIAVLTLSLGLGAAPWISFVLALSFAGYGVLKKNMSAGPVVSVTAEVLVLTPLALVWLWGVHNQGWGGVTGRNLATFGTDLSDSLLLMLSGPLTGAPLVLFSYGSRRITLATAGLVQYLNPTLQFLCATLIFAEPFTRWHAIAFPLIWLALAIYTVEALRQDRSARRAAARSATESATPI